MPEYIEDRLYIMETLKANSGRINQLHQDNAQMQLRLTRIEADTSATRVLIETEVKSRLEHGSTDRKGVWNVLGILIAAIAGGAVTVLTGLLQKAIGP